MTFEELCDNFSFLESWEEKYQYLIELGDTLPPFDEADKTPANKVEGCMSQVWLTHWQDAMGRHFFKAASDAHIVRGLEAIILTLVNGKTDAELHDLDLLSAFRRLGLEEHLSPTRRNGFYAMTDRIRQLIK